MRLLAFGFWLGLSVGCDGPQLNLGPDAESGLGGTGGNSAEPSSLGGATSMPIGGTFNRGDPGGTTSNASSTGGATSTAQGLTLEGLTAFSFVVESPGFVSSDNWACWSSGPVVWHIDMAAKQLSWKTCEMLPDASVYSRVTGSQTLSDLEMTAVWLALRNMSTDYELGCGADAGVVSVELTYADHSAVYRDDFYAGCTFAEPLPEGVAYARNVEELFAVLTWPAEVPTQFDSLELRDYPLPSSDLSWTVPCDWAESRYAVDATTRELSWTFCRAPTAEAPATFAEGSRILSETELATISVRLSQLALGASGDCTTVRSNKSLGVTHDMTGVGFSSDVGACAPDGNNSNFVVGLDAFSQTLAGLVNAAN